jgi:hypothetical protein
LENAKVGAIMAKEVANLRSSYSKPMFPRMFAPPTLVGSSKSAPTSSASDSDSEGIGRVAKVAKMIKPRMPPVEFSDSSELDSDVGDTDARGVWTKQTRRVKAIASSLGPSAKSSAKLKSKAVPPKQPSSSQATKSKESRDGRQPQPKEARQPHRGEFESDDAAFYRPNVRDKRRDASGKGTTEKTPGRGGTVKPAADSPGGFGGRQRGRGYHTSTLAAAAMLQPVVVGGAVLDVMCKPKPGSKLVLETSNPGHVTQQFGGMDGCSVVATVDGVNV